MRNARQRLTLSPSREVAAGGGEEQRSYADILRAQQLAREKEELQKKLERQQVDAALVARAAAQAAAAAAAAAESGGGGGEGGGGGGGGAPPPPARPRRRWDDAGPAAGGAGAPAPAAPTPLVGSFGGAGAWGATPLVGVGGFGGGGGGGVGFDATPLVGASRWESTPLVGASAGGAAPKRSRWEETPVVPSALALAAAAVAAAAAATPLLSGGAFGGARGGGAAAPLLAAAASRAEAELFARNKPLSDEDLDALLPKSGFRVLLPPASYVPLRDPARKLTAAPTPLASSGFFMAPTPARESYGVPLAPDGTAAQESAPPSSAPGLPFVKPEDAQFFAALTGAAGARAEEALSPEELKARTVATLLLKIKNGTPPQRKASLRALAERARELGAAPLFSALLPLLMSPTLEDGERHVLVKATERVLYALDDAVRPYAHKILTVVQPMLVESDFYVRVEGRELIANLAKACGLATMISVMRPDIDSPDEFARNTTARALAVVAGALGIGALLPFLRAVTASKKSADARTTGVRVVQHTAALLGCAVLPHLGALVGAVGPCLGDSEQRVRVASALALAALAEAAAPYGIEAFDPVLAPLWKGAKSARGKALAAHIRAVGAVIPLMDADIAAQCTRDIMPSLVREFASPDDDMRKVVLKTVAQCIACEAVDAGYVRGEVAPEFFVHFWTRRVALDRRNYRAVVDTTLALALRVGAGDVAARMAPLLKDEAETLRRMALEALERVLAALGASDLSDRAVEELVDGAMYAFQEQGVSTGADAAAPAATAESRVVISAFGTLVGALGTRAKPFFPQVAAIIKWRLNNKAPQLRMLAADLMQKVAPVMKACGEDPLLGHLGNVLFECLGEEYPDVLGSLLGSLRSIVAVIGLPAMQPPIKDLLPRLTPILKNRSEKVQENCIDLVGRIADRGADAISLREWVRICFELLELLHAPRKAIRRAAVNTFGYIAKAVGPQEVLHHLINNLKVAERTSRVCTTVAIGIVAETCEPATVLPALLNEYRTPDMNVQNGVLKSLSFMFEYIGEVAKDYVHAVTPLLVDALMDRDAVHRQIACNCVKHLALGLQGAGAEDALLHLLNYVWPNVYEKSPHVISAVFEAVEALRVSLGPGVIFAYLRAGLFHPARRVREVHWRLYNNLVAYSGHALPAWLPSVPEETEEAGGGGGRYERSVLLLCA